MFCLYACFGCVINLILQGRIVLSTKSGYDLPQRNMWLRDCFVSNGLKYLILELDVLDALLASDLFIRVARNGVMDDVGSLE